MKLTIPSVSAGRSPREIAQAIETSHGLLTLTGLPMVPFEEIKKTFDHLSTQPNLTDRLNEAYPKNLVYKDAYSNGKGGPSIDQKRVLDLSPERLEIMKSNDPGLALEEARLEDTLAYWEQLRSTMAPKIAQAVGLAVGAPLEDAAFNYRMVDYYERDASAIPPRCGEHRDFGSFTLGKQKFLG